MTVVAFAGAKGSPGVTTSVLALAGCWPAHREAVVVEADGAGGDLVAWFAEAGGDVGGVRVDQSTVQLAAAARNGLSDLVVLEHLQRLPGSGEVRALVAPSSPFAAATALGSLLEAGLAECALRMSGVDVLVDLGRLDAGSAGVELARRLGGVVLVTRPRVANVIHSRDLALALRQTGVSSSLLVVGDSPFTPAEVAHCIGGLPVVGVLADDASAAAALCGSARSARAWTRSRLARSAAPVADRVAPSPVPTVSLSDAGDALAQTVAVTAPGFVP